MVTPDSDFTVGGITNEANQVVLLILFLSSSAIKMDYFIGI